MVPKQREETLKTVSDLKNYLKTKGKNHHCFKYYSKDKYIDEIISSHSVYLTNGEHWNDRADAENLRNCSDDCKRYVLCLSFSKSENVAMWMLYSGNKGRMIDYDKNTISEILNAEKVELGEFENEEFKAKEVICKPNFELEITDVIYYGDGARNNWSSKKYYVRRSDERYNNFSKRKIDKLNYQKKKLPWSYENECRIVLTIKSKSTKVLYSTARIEFPEKCIKKLRQRVYNSPNNQDKKYKNSKMKEDMCWNLCRNCKKENT